MTLRRELEPFASNGREAYGIVESLFAEIVVALKRDQRFTNVPRSDIELLLADLRTEAERRLFNELRDRVHLDDVDVIDGVEQ